MYKTMDLQSVLPARMYWGSGGSYNSQTLYVEVKLRGGYQVPPLVAIWNPTEEGGN